MAKGKRQKPDLTTDEHGSSQIKQKKEKNPRLSA
jgi:hypothetical protein